ncbi:P-loop containing nucleoside triphosphate hydrolase protein [Podospora appendiculata]|uniref:P-loop containing nucleoside triphosphate hydrolase protein n=1 Tax=Podospora appendiculata TaxID=314037 RepID=A0AAE1C7C2_9PEZI|nr:P-loop containing nucleoside triphosphate hydrolase protein [Podospora appendiculata]
MELLEKLLEKLNLPLSRSQDDARPVVVMMCGIAGSGKSTLSKAIVSKYPNFERLSIDANVHAKHGLYDIDFPAEKYPEYQVEADAEVRARLVQLLENGESDAVLDRALYLKVDRDYFKRIVEEKGGRWILVYFRPANKEVLWNRVQSRRRTGIDADSAFEITPELLSQFWEGFEVPDGEGEVVVAVGG